MKYLKSIIVCILFVGGLALNSIGLSGCDTSPNSTNTSYEEIGILHNKALAESFNSINKRSIFENEALIKNDNEINMSEIEKIYWNTNTGHENKMYKEDLDKGMNNLRQYIAMKKGFKAQPSQITLEDLNGVGILSDRQSYYIEEMKRVDGFAIEDNEFNTKLKSIENQAISELGEYANAVLIFSVTYRNSTEYWKTNGAQWFDLPIHNSKKLSKTMAVNWKDVAAADGAGAVIGCVSGIMAGVKASTGALVFGPGGVILTVTASAIAGGFSGAAMASLAKALEQYFGGS